MFMFVVLSITTLDRMSTDISFPPKFINKKSQRELASPSLTMATIAHHPSPAAPRRAGYVCRILEALCGATTNLRGSRSRIDQWKMADSIDYASIPVLYTILL